MNIPFLVPSIMFLNKLSGLLPKLYLRPPITEPRPIGSLTLVIDFPHDIDCQDEKKSREDPSKAELLQPDGTAGQYPYMPGPPGTQAGTVGAPSI